MYTHMYKQTYQHIQTYIHRLYIIHTISYPIKTKFILYFSDMIYVLAIVQSFYQYKI